jgi:hypothetical protein
MGRKEEYFEILGQITVFFSTLDSITTTIIVKITREDVPLQMSDTMTLKQKFRILEKYSDKDVVDNNILVEIKNILPEAPEISEKRNRFIHDQWVFDENTLKDDKILRYRLKGIKSRSFESEKSFHEKKEFKILLREIGSIQEYLSKYLNQLN